MSTPDREQTELILRAARERYLLWRDRAAGHTPADRRPEFNATASAVKELQRCLARLLAPATGLLSAVQGAMDYSETRLLDLRARIDHIGDELHWLQSSLQPFQGTGSHHDTNASAWVRIVLDTWVFMSHDAPSTDTLKDALEGFNAPGPPVVGRRILEATMKQWRAARTRQST